MQGKDFRSDDVCVETLKVGVLVSHPIQYFVPVYRALASNPRVDLSVIFRTRVGVDPYLDKGFGQVLKWDVPLLEGYSSEFLSKKLDINGFERNVVGAILRHRFDVLVVHGYSSLTNILAIVVSKMIGCKVLVRGDTRLQERHRSAPFWKSIFKRFLFRFFDGFISIGKLNREYYRYFGASASKVFFAPFCVSNSSFALSESFRRSERSSLRASWGIPESGVVVLYASKIVDQKRPDDLVNAFSRVSSLHPDAYLVIAGSGPRESALRDLVARLCQEKTRFIGFQNQTDLPGVYAAADVFVLPSGAESWGLVVNEVMAAGLPVIVTDQVGAAPDLVEGRQTGIVYPCGDVDMLSEGLGELLGSAAKRESFGENARQLIQKWSVESCANGIAEAAFSVSRK